MSYPARHERGAATVELALVMPIVLLIIMGIIEFGRVMSVLQILNTAAREGARIAAMPGSDNTDVAARINQELAGVGLPDAAIQTVPGDISAAARDEPVSVRVSLPYEAVAWVPGFIPGFEGATLQAAVVMRKEGFAEL